jgi:quinoprotein glucose dehydrogenase
MRPPLACWWARRAAVTGAAALELCAIGPLTWVLRADSRVRAAPPAQAVAAAWPISSGVYSTTQAQRGLVRYANACEHCHGASLTGDATAEVPSLVADAFLFHWRGRTLQQLYDRLRTSMPADAPGSVGESGYVDLIAYLLEANGFPPGGQDLDRGRLGAVVIEKAR